MFFTFFIPRSCWNSLQCPAAVQPAAMAIWFYLALHSSLRWVLCWYLSWNLHTQVIAMIYTLNSFIPLPQGYRCALITCVQNVWVQSHISILEHFPRVFLEYDPRDCNNKEFKKYLLSINVLSLYVTSTTNFNLTNLTHPLVSFLLLFSSIHVFPAFFGWLANFATILISKTILH
jgi:hypothetical protein